ncbi:Uncharacterized protein dnm_067950 [Desulfonema magnum]|uniref:Uncharacterized protein n=1 Tax=Desulfonema magnum TaxID=45655 RepID=A0A975GR90_9BACT|nr:Uncharacterized protein dnm_067950 [Desulfonema magnum]
MKLLYNTDNKKNGFGKQNQAGSCDLSYVGFVFLKILTLINDKEVINFFVLNKLKLSLF